MANAFEVKDISPENIDTKPSYSKDDAKIETISVETIPTPDYNYGNGQDTIDAELALRNIRTGGNSQVGSFSFSSTWNLSVTWLDFTPKSVLFSFCDAGGTGYGNGAMSSTAQWAFDVINSKSQITSQCIYVRNSGGTAVGRAVYVSMNSDWFTINVTVAGTTINVSWTAIG